MAPITLIVMVLVVFIAGWVAGSISTRKIIKDEIEVSRDELLEELKKRLSPVKTTQEKREEKPSPPAISKKMEPQKEELSPEILAVLSSAVAAFIGKQARIRSVALLGQGSVSPWAQQGRVSIQASHLLRRS